MKRILFVAAVAAVCATSCTRSMKGHIVERTFYSVSLVNDEGNTVNFTTVETETEAIGEIYANDYVKINYTTLKTDQGNFRSIKKVKLLEPCLYRRIPGKWSVGGSESEYFEFIMGGAVNAFGFDSFYAHWSVKESPLEEPLFNFISLKMDENGISNIDHFYGFTMSEDGNSLTITDKETGETVWDLTRIQN